MDTNAVIKTLTLGGNSLKKLYKFLPEDCIKAIPNKISDISKNSLEININGVVFTGEDDGSRIVINSSNRNYTKEDLIAFQKIAVKCYTYPFGGLEFSFGLNIFSNDKTEKAIRGLLNNYKLDRTSENLDTEGHIELKISDVKDFSTISFINFILELQTLTYLLDEKYDEHLHMQ